MTNTIEKGAGSRRSAGVAQSSRWDARRAGGNVPRQLGAADYERAVPEKVRAYFKERGSRRRRIWAVQVHSYLMGWKDIDWASRRLVARLGHRESSGAWPMDATMIQFTDGEIFADFARGELGGGAIITADAMEGRVAA